MAWRTITLNNNGGSGTSPTTLYYNTTGYYWATAKNTGTSYRIYALTKTPTRANYILAGFFTSTSGGTQMISASGSLWNGYDPGGDVTIYARWNNYATITLNKGEYGTGGTSAFYYKLVGGGFYSNTALTTAITSITPPTGGGTFGGYKLNGTLMIDRGGAFTPALLSHTFSANATLLASWIGGCIDWFGLSSSALVPIASTTGDTRHRVAVSHGGKYESGVNEVGKVWRNPSVTYVVKANTTVAVQLGKAWKPRNAAGQEVAVGASTIAVSGFMITTVEIVTEVGKFPTVTVSAVANEGANAVNNFTVNANKFNVSVPVVARSKAQNLLNAINGGGHLQSCRLVAACDPVVCEENLMPCASDIVNGRYELSAETLAPNGEAAPTMTAASGTNGGFALIDDPQQGRDCDFVRYTIQARREMV
jgi:hypothetical protein